MKKHPPPLTSPIAKKMAWAATSYHNFKNHLLADKEVVLLLKRLQRAIQDSRAAMGNAGVSAVCRDCDELEGGSCCGSGLEDRYDVWLLLINRLLGAQLPTESRDIRSCFFLGENGCVLQARHVICINYVCRRITDAIPTQSLQFLREKEGDEVTALFSLNERIKSILPRGAGDRWSRGPSPSG